MAERTPETVVFVSNAGGPEIQVMAMDRASGALDLIDKVPVPGKASPTSMSRASSPGRGRRGSISAMSRRPRIG